MHGLQLNFEFTSQKSAGIQTTTLYQYRHRVISGPMELGNLLSAAFGEPVPAGGLEPSFWLSPSYHWVPRPLRWQSHYRPELSTLSIKSKVAHKLPEKPNASVLVSHIRLTAAHTCQRELTPLHLHQGQAELRCVHNAAFCGHCKSESETEA